MLRKREARFNCLHIAALFLLLASLPSKSETLKPPLAPAKTTAYIAIIIDDIGNSRRRGELAIELPGPLTFAVIPDTTHGNALARYAHATGKEVMVHLPMENTRNRPLGRLALTSGLTEADYPQVIARAIQSVPHASGLNNHMGSALTQEPQAMAWLMRAVKQHQLFFVDSRTTHKTVARRMAERENILAASRDVFLDNERTLYAIDRQFRKLVRIAKQRGTAIGIGHPYGQTIEYLERAIPQLEDEGIYILPASSILKYQLAERQFASAGTGAE